MQKKHKQHSVCKISHDYIQATVYWWYVPGRQQKIESIRDRIRWAVWTVVITGNDCNRFEIVPIWTQSGFKLNRTNLNRSQSIYMWTRSYFSLTAVLILNIVQSFVLFFYFAFLTVRPLRLLLWISSPWFYNVWK